MPKPPPYPHNMAGDYAHLPAYGALASKIEREGKAALTTRERLEASKSPERREAEARLRANKLARDREFEASASQRAAATPLKVASASKAAPAKAAAKPADTAYADGLGKGFVTGRDTERARIKAVAAVAIERGQAADALKMLATDADAPSIIAKLKETNLLAEAMLKRFGGAA